MLQVVQDVYAKYQGMVLTTPVCCRAYKTSMLSINVWLRRPQCVAGSTRRVCQVSRYGLDDPSLLQVLQDEYAAYQGMA